VMRAAATLLLLPLLGLAVDGAKIFSLSFEDPAGLARTVRTETKESVQGHNAYCELGSCPRFGVSGVSGFAVRFNGAQVLRTPGVWFKDGSVSAWFRILGLHGGTQGNAMIERPHGGTSSTKDWVVAGSPSFSVGRIANKPGWYNQNQAQLSYPAPVTHSWGGMWCGQFWHYPTDIVASSEWQHVAFVFSGDYFIVYYNGQRLGQVSALTVKSHD